ncbi:alternative ribosome rescue aminoacyl-tRNA hydrolase ArfB [Nakamurella sp. UYEF19]|uniref:alternative ribosome rescue aminoacyl-tRNA hydrolase ArfB n=1 Tax=Nakamurella sp. UYEF19 TaxID=1756392 RepID=UPI0033931AB5
MDAPLRVNERLTIGLDELNWRFSRSSGPGGQGVNTADSRVELTWNPGSSVGLAAAGEAFRARLLDRLAGRLVNGSVVIAVSEHRAQLRNRETARLRLIRILRDALAPPPAARHPSRPSRGSIERRLAGKKARSAVKATRSSRGHRSEDQ